ncbi:TIGR03808 family TAT-translocated repetitive protein [Devosia algicola]|uniref:TIGR03808 family TAT-translocated repetitive protein n=1 Tax=Devosia algicola TaxID=3026418 RepID=A0ABY7YN69_9HYPH|nr:TIGR03808 family TAT-translocated repetitive protein [Devosia algicola]WDR02716.1 TIGR03808 family TAT-translocated repetitive protein [Devosia algicola]
MKTALISNRRRFLASIGAASLVMCTASRAQSLLDGASLGIVSGDGTDQTVAVQQAIDNAAASGQTLILPPGDISVGTLAFPARLALEGSGNATILRARGAAPVARIGTAQAITITGLGFAANIDAPTSQGPLLDISASDNISLVRCQFSGGGGGIATRDSALNISDCHFADLADAAIHSANSRGLLITNNRIARCGNAGIRIWRDEAGPDGSIVRGNRIAAIDWRDGGNGQNGNGINIYRADEVIIADNHIDGCAFSAIRLNSTRNSQVSGNLCLNAGEVAIFSEFAFSGSVIANNIIDNAATGISITNLDQGGRLAVCSGNIVRNITPNSAVNPDTIPIGIYAEADTAISGNSVSNVPGIAIMAGYGSFLDNVLIASNVVSEADYGIGVSVVEESGSVHIAGNLIAARKAKLVGLRWQEVVSTDLGADIAKFPNVTLNANS